MKYYGNSHESLEKLLSTDFRSGLSDKEAKKRLSHYGMNNIFDIGDRSPSKIIYKLLYDPVSILLLISALICFSYSSFTAAYIIISVWIINSFTTIVAYYKADAIFYTLKSYGIPKVNVLRDSKMYMIDSRLLVPGDIILVEAGDIVCADCKIVKAENLLAYEYDICGSNKPRSKFVSDDTDSITLSEMHGMLFASSSIVSGHGVAVVVKTGEQTEVFCTAGKIPLSGKHQPELFFDVKKRCRSWGILSTLVITVLFLIKLLASPTDIFDSFMLIVALLGASMSESLLPLTQVVTARGIAHNAQSSTECRSIIKNAGAIESLRDISFLIVTPEILEYETDDSISRLRHSWFNTVVCATKREAFALATKYGIPVCTEAEEIKNMQQKLCVYISDKTENALELISFLQEHSHKTGALTTKLNYIRLLKAADVSFAYGSFKYKTIKLSKESFDGVQVSQKQILSRVSDVICEPGLRSVCNSSECAKNIFSTVTYSGAYLLTMQFIRVILSALSLFGQLQYISFSDILISGMVIDLIFVFIFSFFDDLKTERKNKFSTELLHSALQALLICLFLVVALNIFADLNTDSFLPRAACFVVLLLYPLFSILHRLKLKDAKKDVFRFILCCAVILIFISAMCFFTPLSQAFSLTMNIQAVLISVITLILSHFMLVLVYKFFSK